MHARAALAIALGLLVAVAQTSAPVARAATVVPATTSVTDQAVALAPKVVIVVGAVESTTSSYRTMADAIYAEAIKWTPNVIRVYSPNATWDAVKAAAQGASIFVYLGHGYGWPSPYSTSLRPDVQDGMGLNASANNGDSNKKYYGESCVDGVAAATNCPNNGLGIRFAANAVVVLNHLCYAPGAGESGMAEPTIAVAKQRVDNFASGFIRAGARAVIADDYTSSVQTAIRLIFSTHQSMLGVWRSLPGYHGNEIPWAPARNPAFQAVMDPLTWTSGFYRSIVTDAALKTDDVLAGAAKAPTGTDPSSLTVPGAASVISASLPAFTDQTLGTASGATLALGTKLRVDQVVAPAPAADGTTPPPAVRVHTLDGSIAGWVSGAGLAARDSVGPQLWSTTGPTTISPNFDGNLDTLNLWDRLSEVATWTATLVDPAGKVLRTQTGTSDLVPPTWDGLVGGAPAPAGTYHWTLHAADAWGNPALDASGAVTVVSQPIPATAVLAFKSLSGTYTRNATLAYELDFAAAVTGVAAADFSRTGTATACVVGAPTGGGATWYLTVSGCSNGTVLLTLAPNSVLNASLVPGPAAAVSAPPVIIDRTAPTTSAPLTGVRTGQTFNGTPVGTVSWTGADSGGSGVASYDLERSVNGGTYGVIATGVASPGYAVALPAGSTYRFAVRARDRAGNLGAWTAGATTSSVVRQDTSGYLAYGAGWRQVSASAYSGGSVHYATAAGASLRYTFIGRSIGLVTSLASDRGAVRVYLDGSYVTTLNLYRAVAAYRQVAWARTYSSPGTHTLMLVVVGTAGRPRVDVDAFLVLR